MEPVNLDPEPAEESTLKGLARYCSDLYTEYKDSQYRQDKLDQIAEGRKRYRGDLPAKDFPWKGCSNKTMGLEAIAVDNLEPRVKAQLIAEEDFVQVEPVGAEDVPNVDYVKDMAHWAFQNNMRVEKQIRPFVHDLLLDGTKDAIPIWNEDHVVNYRRGMKPVFVDQMGQRVDIPQEMQAQLMPMMQQGLIRQAGSEEAVNESVELTFKVELDLIDINQAFFPDTWEDWDDAPYLYFIYPTLDELYELSEENGGPYYNLSEDLIVDPERTSGEEKDQDADDKGVKHSEYTRQVKLLRCFVKEQGEWVLVEFAVDKAWREVRKQAMNEVYRHGRKPVHRFRLFPEENESMGTGIPAKIKHFSKGVDDCYNMMIDSGTIEINPWFLYEKAPGTVMKQLEVYPGAGNEIAKGTVPHFPNLGVKSPQFMNFINMLMEFFERMISLMDANLSGPRTGGAPGTQTASGMQLIVQEGNIKHSYMGEALQDQFAELLTDCFELYAHYMPMDAKRAIFEDNQWAFQDIDVLRLQGQYDFKIQVSQSSANAMLNRQEKVELYQMAAGNALSNQAKLLEDLYKSYGIKTTSEYIQPQFQMMMQALQQAPELAQMIQQYLQQKQQQASDQQIQGEAQANVRRQQIEREVERGSQLEGDKIYDQAGESIQREIAKAQIEQQMAMQQMNQMGV